MLLVDTGVCRTYRLLAHLLLAELTRWLVARLWENGRDDPVLVSVLEFLEKHFASGGEHVSELIAVSVLETRPDVLDGSDVEESSPPGR